MRRLGLDVHIDSIGNIAGLRAGLEAGPAVLMGSHTDTVATGGRYDGSLGVLAALEVMECLNAAGIETQKPIGVVSFVNEEGVRFMPDMMGSLFWTEQLDLEATSRHPSPQAAIRPPRAQQASLPDRQCRSPCPSG